MALTTKAGSHDFAQELQEKMKKRGYTNLNFGIGQMTPVPQFQITVRKDKRNGNSVIVYVD